MTDPIQKANVHNAAQPAANTNILASDITLTNAPVILRTEVAMSNAGNFSAVIIKSGNSQVVTLNAISGPALVAGALYVFDIVALFGDTVNFQYSATGGTIQVLRVYEIHGY